MSTQIVHEVIIIGSGPSGYTAAIYAARAMLHPLIITGTLKGGQLITTTEVENFPGYPKGITGPVLMEELEDQAVKFGTRVQHGWVQSVDVTKSPFELLCNDEIILTKSIIIATGAKARWLNIKDEESLRSNGISTCATCDGAFFKGEDLLVIGGGDSAMEEAIFLTRYGRMVTIVHRRDKFRASKIMLERAEANPKIKWKTNSMVKTWLTDESGVFNGALLQDITNGNEEVILCGGAFIAIGHDPSTGFLENQIAVDEDGYIKYSEYTMTSVPGIFACGDVCVSSKRYKQAITASGEGCRAAMDCEKWLEQKK